MLYIRCWGDPKDKKALDKFEVLGRKEERELQDATKKQSVNGVDFFFLSKIEDDRFEIGAMVETVEGFSKKLNHFLKSIDLELVNVEYEEVVFSVIDDMLDTAEMYNFVRRRTPGFNNEFERIRRGMRSDDCDEMIIDKCDRTVVYQSADEICIRNSLFGELDRIYQGKKCKRVSGHPVHYMIETDDKETADNTVKALIQALYDNGRVESRRVTTVLIDEERFHFSGTSVARYYPNCSGSTLVIDYYGGEEVEGNRANAAREVIERICGEVKKYRNQVLTILCLPKECTRLKDLFFEYLGDISIVELKEDFVLGTEAKQILEKKARKRNVHPDKQLVGSIEDGEEYFLRDLNQDFEEWFGRKLKRSVYPQYQGIHSVKKEVEETPKGSAFEDLEHMVGIMEAKTVIRQALDYYKARKLFREKGMMQNTPSMHMVFTGNPGTAKTTVARLFSRIMKDNGILSTGKLVEVGRGDLVGKFVGWTAPTVKKKFSEAKGGVLFIDEAYSLVDDKDGLYGDEAINTIVQEMENHREEVIVIFAGYPDKMEKFLQKNPGLRSRIAFHVPFKDYNADELCDIATLLAEKCGMRFTEDAYDKLRRNFTIAMEQSDFGNGRYVRNVIEKARMAQSSRLLSMDIEQITRDDVATLCGDDIEVPEVEEKSTVVRFGFCG